jgi:serine/threonine protein kinase
MPQRPIPPVIADYRLLALIGQGSYGDVWLAQGLTGPLRAIKVVWRHRFADDDPYLRELLGLQHFAAVSLLESGQLALLHVGQNERAGFFYYVMEAADDAGGGPIDPRTYTPNTLSRALRRRKRIPAPQTLAIAASLAGGLAGLHARGLVHRDIKPSNIIFVAGTAKLADIGTVASITTAHPVSGTPGYAPLEGPGTPAADVFSLGIVLYELVMGQDRAKFPRLPENLASLPDRNLVLELNEIIARACDPSPARRHADGSSLLDEIRSLQQGTSVRQQRRRSRHLLVGGIGLGTAAALVGLAVLTPAIRDRRRRPREIYQGALGRAALALDLGDLSRARRELLAVRPAGASDPPGFEWSMLWNDVVLRGRDSATSLLPAASIRPGLGISRDGMRLASTGPGPTLQLLTAESLLSVASVRTAARPAGFLPDDSVFAWADAGTLHTWSPRGGLAEIACLTMGRAVRLVALASDGTLVAAAGAGGRLELWEVPGSRPRHSILAHPGKVITGLAVSWQGERVATVDEALLLRTWRADRGNLESQAALPGRARALAFGPDGGHLALALESGGLELRRLPDLRVVAQIGDGGPGFHAVAFDPAGRRLLAGESTGALSVYDTADWSELARIPAGPSRSPVESLAFSADGRTLAAQLADGTLRVWPLVATSLPANNQQ